MFQDIPSGNPPAYPYLEGWRARIVQARQRGSFTSQDEYCVSHWNLCAVGEAKAKYPEVNYEGNGLPREMDLRTLGGVFTYQVRENYFDGCEQTIADIENAIAHLRRAPVER